MSEAELKDFPSIFSLKGKVVVVTGGSRGLGLHAASGFLQAGASKVYISSRKAAGCEAAVKELNALPNLAPGATAISAPADSSTEDGVKSLVEQVSKTTDHVDILFANAGATWGAPFDKYPDSAWGKVMDLNVRAVFNTVKLFAPLLEKNATIEDPSRVIVTASIAGLGISSGGPYATYAYDASKAAVIHVAKTLAVELAPRGVLVNSIAPGFFPSKMANSLIESQGGLEQLSAKNPNRRLGRAEDIAGAVVFLSSRAAGHINGATITIDGGSVLGRSRI